MDLNLDTTFKVYRYNGLWKNPSHGQQMYIGRKNPIYIARTKGGNYICVYIDTFYIFSYSVLDLDELKDICTLNNLFLSPTKSFFNNPKKSELQKTLNDNGLKLTLI